MKKSIAIGLILSLLISACQNRSAEETSSQKTETTEHDGIFLSVAQLSEADFKLGKITKHRLSFDVHSRGKLVIPSNQIISVGSLYDCLIKQIDIQMGETVAKGQKLGSYQSANLIKLQEEFLKQLYHYEYDSIEFMRQKYLSKENINAKKTFQESKAAFYESQTKLLSLEQQLKAAGISPGAIIEGGIQTNFTFVSPINGTVNSISSNTGGYANAGTMVFEIHNTDKLLLELNVFEKDIMRVKLGQRVTFKLPSIDDHVYEAFVISISNIVDDEGRTVNVYAEFDNADSRLLGGMFISSEIHTEEHHLHALPEEAIIRDENNHTIIYYSLENDLSKELQFYSTQVNTGFEEDGYVEIINHQTIPAEAFIVIDGAYYIHSEKLKNLE